MEASPTNCQFAHWRLSCADQIAALAPWTEFCLSLGHQLSRLPKQENKRYVIGLSVPTRNYVASFMLAGFWIGKALSNSAASARAHFQWLQSLPDMSGATYARVHSDTKKWALYKGYLLKPKCSEFVRFCYAPNNLCWDVSEEYSLFITPTGSVASAHNQNRKPTELNIGADFWHSVGLSPQALAMIAANQRTSVCLIGVIKQLQKEFSEILLLPSQNSQDSMAVADICRLRMPQRETGFLTNVINSIAKDPITSMPEWTLFDARLAFSRQHRRLKLSNWIVIADRFQDQQHTDNVQALNTIYVESKNRLNIHHLLPHPPTGLGITAFEMEIQ